VKVPGLTETYTSNLGDWNPLDTIRDNLEAITARYRVGDGSGATFATAAYSCSQDASQAMFDAITEIEDRILEDPAPVVALTMDPAQATRLQDLMGIQHDIKDKMSFLWKTRKDWKDDPQVYGKGFDDGAIRNFLTGLGSFRMMLPPVAYRSTMDVLLKYNAEAFVLRTNQVGGWDPEIAPVAPNV
jgi:predicted Abi (CAAX) family protease